MSAVDITVQACGAGVQSSALLLLSCEGALPKPDVAIFADTGWEPAEVYAQVDRLERLATEHGIAFHRVSNGNLRHDAVDPALRYASIPYFVLNPPGETAVTITCPRCSGSGEVYYSDTDDEDFGLPPDLDEPVACPRCQGDGKVPEPSGATRPLTQTEREGMGRRQCTNEYKLTPITRKVRELLGARPPDYRRVPKGRLAEQWIGFSTDEVIRANRRKDSQGVSYLTTRYPLLELGMSRADCERYLSDRGWGRTVKSACIGCPYHGNAQWRDLRDNHPEEWADAVEFDRQIRKGGARGIPLNGEAFLHRSRVPLDQAPIDRRTRAELAAMQLDIFDVLEEGDRGGCSPFGCRSETGGGLRR